MTAPAQRSTCIGALPSNVDRRFPLDRTVFGMLKPMAYHLSPAIDSTMDGERPPPTRRNFPAALEGPTSSLARRNPGQAFCTNPCSEHPWIVFLPIDSYSHEAEGPCNLKHPAAPPRLSFRAATCVCVRPCHGRGRVGPGRRIGCSVRGGPTLGRTTRPGRPRTGTKVTRCPECPRDAGRRLP